MEKQSFKARNQLRFHTASAVSNHTLNVLNGREAAFAAVQYEGLL